MERERGDEGAGAVVVLCCSAPRCGARYRLKRGALTGRRCRRCGSALAPESPEDEAEDARTPTVELPLLPDLDAAAHSEATEPAETAASAERFDGYDRIEPVWSDEKGELLRGRDVRANRVVAIRVLPARKTADATVAASFLERAQHTARLEHPGIVVIHEIGLSGRGELYATRHWIDGERLGVRLERWRRRDNPPALPRRLEMFIKVCDALAYSHARGVTHGAISAESVILGDYGEVIVLDWDRQGDFSGAAASSPTGDLADLGALLRHILTLVAPRERGRRLAAAMPQVPRELEAVVLRASGGGYGEVRELQRDIEAFLDGQMLLSVRYTAAQRLGIWARRHRGALALIGLVAALASGFTLAVAWRDYRGRQDAIQTALEREALLPDATRLPGWSLVDQGGDEQIVSLDRASPAREAAYAKHHEACRAWEEVLALIPDEPAARDHRLALGERLGRIALLGGEWSVARRHFQDLAQYGATPKDLAAFEARLERLRTAGARVRQRRVQAIVEDIAGDLSRPGRPPTAPALDEHVLETLRLADERTAHVLGTALDQVSARRAKSGGVSPVDRDLATYCCRVLGRLRDPAASLALERWSVVPLEHRLVVEAGCALVRVRRPEARRALDALRDRLGADHPSWLEVDRFRATAPGGEGE